MSSIGVVYIWVVASAAYRCLEPLGAWVPRDWLSDTAAGMGSKVACKNKQLEVPTKVLVLGESLSGSPEWSRLETAKAVHCC